MKRPADILLSVTGFLTGSALNIFLTILVIVLIINFTKEYYAAGQALVAEEVGGGPSVEVTVEIPEDAGPMEISAILEEQGLIDNGIWFFIQARLNGSYKYFEPGTFDLNMNMTTAEIMEALQAVPVVETGEVEVRITEGYNIRLIAELLESKGFFTAEEFLSACERRDYDYWFLEDIKDKDNYLEGYLFPDTYRLNVNPTPEEVITKMLNRFGEIFDSDFRLQAEERGISVHDAVIAASIIEREIKVPEERALASAVIRNRLAADMKLEVDATVMYVLDKRRERLTYADLEVDSPYNTYMYPGLPIGPISCPGAASLEAALYPSDDNYLYYVVEDIEAGSHFFTNNYDEFLAARDRYYAARDGAAEE